MDQTPSPNNSASKLSEEQNEAVREAPQADQLKQIRAVVNSLLEKAQGATLTELSSAVEKASAALKLESELGKFQAEMQKLGEEVRKLKYENSSASKRERSERFREYISLLTPIVTIVVLAATLIAQNWQFLRSEKDKRDEALDARWQETVKTLSQTGALSPGVIALQPFLNTPTYSEQAKDTALHLLASNTDDVFFDSLFGPAFVPLDKNNLDRVLRLDRSILAKAGPLWTKTWVEQTRTNDLSRLNPEETKIYNYVEHAIPSITAQVGSVLKTSRRISSSLDLSGCYFENGEWQGVDLSGANIENIRLEAIDLKGANLSNINQFTNAFPLRTAWWEAGTMSPQLLEYWETNYKIEPSFTYGPKGVKLTQQEYARALSRLKNKTQ